MAQRLQILCISKQDKTNPHERITSIGGKNANGSSWSVSQEDAISGIETGKWAFFVHQRTTQGTFEANVIVASRNGRKYLKTVNDGESPDNLLSLPQCV